MKNKRTTKIIAGALAIASLIAMNPIGANAAWKQNSTGWWYTEGNSWATGWRTIGGQKYYFYSNGYMATKWLNLDGKWYYFYADGSMAKNSWVDGYYVGEDGAMLQYVGFDKMKLSSETDNYHATEYNLPYHVVDGVNSLSVDGVDYINKFEGTNILYRNSNSTHDYIIDLNNKFKSFKTTVGVDDCSLQKNYSWDVMFIVDGFVKEKRTMKYGESAETLEVDLTGANKLVIRVKPTEFGYYRYNTNFNIMDGKFYFK